MNDNVKSVVRALDILEALAASPNGRSLGEVARLIDAPKSSTLMLLRTLAERSYLERDSNELYRINPILQKSESGWIGGHLAGLIRRAQPVMRRLSESVRETCLLASLTPDGYVRLLAKVVSPREIRYDTDLSQLNPAHRIASGRVQLAHLGSSQLAAYVDRWNEPGGLTRTGSTKQLCRPILKPYAPQGWRWLLINGKPARQASRRQSSMQAVRSRRQLPSAP